MDFTCFILFTLDYNIVMTASYQASLFGATSVSAVLMAAQSASGIMMSVAIRGYLLWVINLALVIYMVILVFKVNTFRHKI